MKLKSSLILFIALTLCFSAPSTFSQKKSNKKSSAKSPKTKFKKTPRTISGGVVNGKAINLIEPKFPKAATMVGVYGIVEVQVLIDTDGNVINAEALSGHPLLRSSSVNAALKSKFEPIKVGNESVNVSGIINYNFLPNTLNWLEIGYAIETPFSKYYSPLKIEDYLPDGFEEEKSLFIENSTNRNEIIESLKSSILNKLSNDSKSEWLFSSGLILGKIKSVCCLEKLEMEDFINQLKIHLLSKPVNISPILISKLENFINQLENSEQNFNKNLINFKLNKLLSDLEKNFPLLGK